MSSNNIKLCSKDVDNDFYKRCSGSSSPRPKQDTPITRVVNLLKEMGETLKKEQGEDEDLNKQLGCWCNNGKYEKNAAIEASTAKIAELTATIEGSDAKSSELANSIKDRYTPEMCVSLLRPTLEQSYFLICSCTVLLQSSFLDHCLQ